MKKIITALVLFFFGLSLISYSQDVIYKKDGSKEEVKVLEINTNNITYKKLSNPDGPAYVIDRGEVVLIAFANGEHELITPLVAEKSAEVKEVREVKEKPFTKDYTRNIMAFHMFDVVFGDIAFSYERILADGRLGIKIPFAFGFYGINPENTPFEFNNLFYSGVGLNFYPTGQGRVRYFLGPNFRFGVGRSGDYIYYYDEFGSYYYDEFQEYSSFYMKYLIDNGVVFMATRNLSISAILSVGMRYIANPGQYVDHIQPDGQFAINLGLRF